MNCNFTNANLINSLQKKNLLFLRAVNYCLRTKTFNLNFWFTYFLTAVNFFFNLNKNKTNFPFLVDSCQSIGFKFNLLLLKFNRKLQVVVCF